MNEDNRVFWHNNEQASALFYDLLARSGQDAYDDNFLMQLAAYREAAPTSERADIFAAKYLLHHGDAENAAVCAERAYRKRPVNREIWLLLAESYARLDRPVDALTMYGYAYGLYLSPEIPMSFPRRRRSCTGVSARRLRGRVSPAHTARGKCTLLGRCLCR